MEGLRGTVRSVAKTVSHPGYRNGENTGPNRDDMALIRLDRPVAEKPVRVADRPGPPGTPTRILGFGRTDDAPEAPWDFPDRLQELDTRRGAVTDCAPGYADRTRLCTISRTPEAMACNGDSGGPQLQRDRKGRWEAHRRHLGPRRAGRAL